MDTRIPWPAYFMGIAFQVAERSTCLRRQVGAVAVRDRRILATGYNGVPKGMRHCLDIGCLREDMGIPSGERHELCRSVHAEMNCIIQARGDLTGAEVYVTTSPCVICAKMLINAGISRVVVAGEYPDHLAMGFLEEAGVEVVRVGGKA